MPLVEKDYVRCNGGHLGMDINSVEVTEFQEEATAKMAAVIQLSSESPAANRQLKIDIVGSCHSFPCHSIMCPWVSILFLPKLLECIPFCLHQLVARKAFSLAGTPNLCGMCLGQIPLWAVDNREAMNETWKIFVFLYSMLLTSITSHTFAIDHVLLHSISDALFVKYQLHGYHHQMIVLSTIAIFESLSDHVLKFLSGQLFVLMLITAVNIIRPGKSGNDTSWFWIKFYLMKCNVQILLEKHFSSSVFLQFP